MYLSLKLNFETLDYCQLAWISFLWSHSLMPLEKVIFKYLLITNPLLSLCTIPLSTFNCLLHTSLCKKKKQKTIPTRFNNNYILWLKGGKKFFFLKRKRNIFQVKLCWFLLKCLVHFQMGRIRFLSEWTCGFLFKHCWEI